MAGAILKLPEVQNLVFEITGPMPYLLEIKGLFGGQVIEDANKHLWNFEELCLPSKIHNIRQESIQLRFFPVSPIGEATTWLLELPLGQSLL